MRSAVQPEVWRRAQSGHLESWAVYAQKGVREGPERAAMWKQILAEVERRRPVRPGERVLDIGCGLDTVLDFLPDVRGYTLDSLMAELACFGLAANQRHTSAAFETMPFRDRVFDRVFCMNVLDHVRDPAAGVAEIARVLVPGGTLVLSVDTYEGRRYQSKRLRKWYDRMRATRTKHPWVFSVPDVRRLLDRAGFDVDAPTHVSGTKERRTFFTAVRRA